MASTITGYPGAVRWRGRWSSDPLVGDTLQHTWTGPKRPIFALYDSFRRARIRATVENRGPLYTVIADIGALQGEDEVPQDEWEIDHEMFQSSIFNVKEVVAEAADYVSKAQYKKDLEDAVRNGESNPLDTNTFPLSTLVYTELSRGNEAMELDRIVLRRVRHFSMNYAGRIKLTTLPNVYTTSALIANFGIPAYIQAQLPDTPSAADTPQYTLWGWKVRRDKSIPLPRINKVKEEKEWVFAAWSRLNNSPILGTGEVLLPIP